MIEHLNHVARTTKDLAASKRFYMEVLGCKEISRPNFSFRGAWLYVGGMQFHLIEDLEKADGTPAINTRDSHVAFSVEDVDAAEAHLKALGIVYKRQVIPGRGIHQIFFQDPDGWLIEFGKYGVIDE